MKLRIIWFLLACAIPVGAEYCAAWIPNDALVREERSVEISIIEQVAEVRIRSSFHNPTSEIHSVQEWFPVVEEAKNIHVFLNKEGGELVEFSDRARLDALADAAEQQQDFRFFRFGQTPWARVFRTKEIILQPDEKLETIWEFSVPVTQQGDFYGLEIFLDDGVVDQQFQLEFSLATLEPIQHFWSPFLSSAMVDRSQFGIVALQQRSKFLPPENLQVIWSSIDNAVARFYMEGHEYRGHFRSLPPAQDFPRVTILLDASGSMSDVWLHVQELLRFLLEHQPNRTFRVALTGSNPLEWIVGNENAFEENTSEMRQKILEAVAWKTPLGKGDISSILSQVGQPQREHLLIIFSDEEIIEPLSNIAPVAVLQFFPKETSSKWYQFAAATRGVVQQAFRSVMGTHEAVELLQSVAEIRKPLLASDIVIEEGETELLPKIFIPQFSSISPVFVGRIPSALQSNIHQTWFEWLPRHWAAARIAEELEQGEKMNYFSTTSLDAILAVARTFGIDTSFFTSETTREELQHSLTESTDIWSVIESLWGKTVLLQDSNVRFMNGIPLWNESGIWRAFNFRETVTPNKWVKIAPFSAAQRQLFVLFPEIFSKPFGIAQNIEFCTYFRCFSVVPGGREEALPSDRAFIRDFDPHHWALPFITDLIDKNILEPALNGKLHLERAVSRGDFARMLMEDSYGKDFPRVSLPPQFTDIAKKDISFDAIQFLAVKGVLGGYKDGTVRPMQDLSRGEAVKILLAMDGIVPQKITPLVSPFFSDTTGWERPWVEEAVRLGIVSGYGDGTFRPHTSLSRAAAAKVIVESR